MTARRVRSLVTDCQGCTLTRVNLGRRPTLADVAAEAGVSQATASRALADSPLVNDNTRRARVGGRRAAAFQPNRLARSLRSGATMAVGLVVPDVGAAFYASALKSAQDVLEAAGYHVLVLNTGRAPEREREALRTLRAHQVDGLLVATSGGYEDDRRARRVLRQRAGAAAGAGAVAMDNDGGIRLLVDHLVDAHGHERIAYIGPAGGACRAAARLVQGTGRERLEAFRAAVGRAGLPLPPEYVRTSEPACSEASGRAAARELMALDAAPDGDRRRQPTRSPSALLRGLRDGGACACPRTSRSCRFDEPGSADLLDPPMTSLDRHDRELGRLAAEALLRSAARRGSRRRRGSAIPLALVVRRSCGLQRAARIGADATDLGT